MFSIPSPGLATTAARSGTGASPAKPSGLSVGDTLLAYAECRSNNSGTPVITLPSGFSIILSGNISSAADYFIIGSKVADAGDVAASTFAFGGFPNAGSDDHGFAGLLKISGTNNFVLVDGTPGNANVSGTTSMSNGGTTPTFIDLFIMIAFHIQSTNGAAVGASGYAVANSNPTWTEKSTSSAGTSDANNLGMSLATAPANTAGATGNATATSASSAGTHKLVILAAKASDSTITYVQPSTDPLSISGLAPITIQKYTQPSTDLMSISGLAPLISIAAATWSFANKPITSWIFRNKP